MANEFKIKNGLVVDQGGANITGSTLISGNVGIGTTSLNNIVPLQINGSGISGIQSGIQFKNVGAGSGFFMSNPSAGNYADFEFWNYENGFFRFGTNNQEILRMTSGGDVGIKTTSPSARLHVKGSGTTDTTNTLRVENSAATPLFVVRDDGNVGIGTASPSYPFQISKNLADLTAYIQNTNAGSYGLLIRAGNTSTYALSVEKYDGTNISRFHGSGNVVIGDSVADTARLFVKGSGATTATTAFRVENSDGNASMIVLDNGSTIISGSALITGSLTLIGDNTISGSQYLFGSLYLTKTSSPSSAGTIGRGPYGMSVRGVDGGSGGYFMLTNEGGDASLVGISGTRHLNAVGNLGVGIDFPVTPSARLHVKGSGTTDTTNTLRVENSAATPSLVVRDDNRVGIGTASPSVKLDIRNGAHGEIFYVIGNPSVNAAGAVYGTDSNVAYLTSAYSTSALGFGINGSYSEFFITTAKNIAIGKYTANAKLDVSGSTIISGSFTVTGSSTFFGDVLPGGPYIDNTSSFSLGSPTAAWKDLYVSNGSIFFVTGSTSASIQLTNNQITFTGASVALPTGSSSPTASYVEPLNQNVIISGSLTVTGSLSLTNNITVNHSTNDARFYLRNTTTGYGAGDGLLWELYDVDAYLWNYENGPFYFGTNATARMTILGNGNIGIGTTTPTALLHIKSANNTNATYNTVWYNSDNTWLAGMRDDGLLALFAFKRIYMNNVHVGEYGTNNTVLGFYAGGTAGYNGGDQNTTVGHYALFAPGASAIQNTAIGYYAGHAITTGQGNVFVGRWAGVDNTTGAENMYLGNNAGQKNSVGSENVAIGTSALTAAQSSSYNVAIGNQAAALLTTGSYNTYVGRSAGANARNTNYNTTLGYATLFGNHSGSENVAIGIYAGAFLTNGSTLNSQPTQSIYIGSYTEASSPTEQNAIVIGHGAEGLGSNTVVLGNDNITLTALKGNIGIGKTTANAKLDVSGSVIITGSLTVSGSSTFTNIGPAILSGSLTVLEGITGSLQGTASYASTAQTVSSQYFCQGSITGNQSINSGEDTVIEYKDDYDPQGWLNSSTFQFSPTIAGYYSITATAWLEATGAEPINQFNLQGRKNNSTFAIVQCPITNLVGQSLTFTKIIYLDGSSDYVDFTVYQASGTTKNIQPSNGTWFSAHLIST